MRPIFSHLDWTSLVKKRFTGILWLVGKCFLQNTMGSPEQATKHLLAHLGNQSQYRIWVILLTHRTSHLINPFNVVSWSLICVLFLCLCDCTFWPWLLNRGIVRSVWLWFEQKSSGRRMLYFISDFMLSLN